MENQHYCTEDFQVNNSNWIEQENNTSAEFLENKTMEDYKSEIKFTDFIKLYDCNYLIEMP